MKYYTMHVRQTLIIELFFLLYFENIFNIERIIKHIYLCWSHLLLCFVLKMSDEMASEMTIQLVYITRNSSIILCSILGLLVIPVLILWLHILITKCKIKKCYILHMMTLLATILCSLSVVVSFIEDINHTILLYKHNKITNRDGIIGYLSYMTYNAGLVLMYALFILRLDITFRGTFLEHKRQTIKLLWCFYTSTLILCMIGIGVLFFNFVIIAISIISLSCVMLFCFIITIFRMFVQKLKRFIDNNSDNDTELIRNLVIKFNVIVSFSISSTILYITITMISLSFMKFNPNATYLINRIVNNVDGCMYIYIYIY